MKTIHIIGDVHGKADSYQKIVRRLPEGEASIQVGDMGIGFPGVGLHKMPDHHKWFRGNHDNPEKCRQTTNYLGDYGYLPEYDLFWLAGAFSIDRAWRIEGTSWWNDEELSFDDLYKAADLYDQVKPKYVLTHECPSSIGIALLAELQGPYFAAKGDCCDSRTSQALEALFQSHQPKEWVFGHYHVDKQLMSKGTLFTCVSELSTYQLKI